MRKAHVLLMAGFLGVVGVGGVHAQQGTSATLTAQDYAEIGQLYAQINHGGDFRDADLWLSAFTDDAVFTIAMGPGQEIAGEGGPHRVAARGASGGRRATPRRGTGMARLASRPRRRA